MNELYKNIKQKRKQKNLLEKKGYFNYQFSSIGILTLLIIGNIITILLLLKINKQYGVNTIDGYHIYTSTTIFIIFFFILQIKKIKNYGKEIRRLFVSMVVGIPSFMGGAALALMFY